MERYRLDREVIAMRVANELQDGDVVNLGLGIPTLCSQFVPEGRDIVYHSESGVLNYGPMAEPGDEDVDLINAGGQFLAPHPGMSFFQLGGRLRDDPRRPYRRDGARRAAGVREG